MSNVVKTEVKEEPDTEERSVQALESPAKVPKASPRCFQSIYLKKGIVAADPKAIEAHGEPQGSEGLAAPGTPSFRKTEPVAKPYSTGSAAKAKFKTRTSSRRQWRISNQTSSPPPGQCSGSILSHQNMWMLLGPCSRLQWALRASTASARSQWALPDLHSKRQSAPQQQAPGLQIAMGGVGPQQQAPDRRALPGFNFKFQIASATARRYATKDAEDIVTRSKCIFSTLLKKIRSRCPKT